LVDVRADFFQASIELFGSGPGPVWLVVRGGIENVLIFFARAFGPGLDKPNQLSRRDTMRQLEAMRRQIE
jgi:hypothetical protein